MPLSDLTDAELDTLISTIISNTLRDPLFLPLGLELLNYKIRFEENLIFNAPACVRYDTGEIFIDKTSEFYDIFSNKDNNRYRSTMKKSESQKKVLTMILLHEVLHPMLLHYKRRKHRDPELWNIAGDFVINLLLANLEKESQDKITSAGGNVEKIVDMDIKNIPPDHIMISNTFDNMIEEEVYAMLEDKGHFKKDQSFMSMGDFLDSIGDGQGDKNPDDVPDIPIRETVTKFDFEGKTLKHTTVEFPQMDPSKMSKEEKENLAKRQKRSQMSNKLLETTLMKGVGSLTMKNFLGRLFNVKIDWEKILKDSLLTALEPSDEETWGTPEVSWLANPWIPYLPSRRDEEVRGIAIFSIDESGSMCDDDVKKAFDIVLQSWEFYKGLYVIKHDHGITWECKYDEKPSLDEVKNLTTRRSYGGTSHKEVFEKINEYLRQDDEARVSVYIGCTDLYSDIEQYQKTFSPDIPRVWIVNSNQKIEGLMGRVIRLK